MIAYKKKMTLLITVFVLILSPTQFIAKDLKLLKEKSFDVKEGQKLTVKSDIGDIIVKAWEKEEILIKIFGDSDAKRE